MNLYRLKRAALAPYVRYMRHKERHQSGYDKLGLELQYYRPTYYRFLGASVVDPEMLYTAPLGPDSLVVDVGAHEGDWAAHLVEKYGCRIVGFEPDPEAFLKLAARWRGNDRVTVFDYGLHDRDAVLDLTRMGMGSTFFDDPMPWLPRQHARGRVRDVAAVLDELAVETIDFLKLNIEGGELEVLDRLVDTGWMPRIRCLLVQFHEWRRGAHRRRNTLRRALRRTHAEDWSYAFVWEKWTLRGDQVPRTGP